MRVQASPTHPFNLNRLAAGLLACMLAGVGGASAQSLAEVAKQEAARREATKGPTKVYTNRDLGPTEPAASRPVPAQAGGAAPVAGAAGGSDTAAATPPASDQAGAAQGAPQAPAPAAASGNDEKVWRKRIADARERLARAEILVPALESRVNALTTDFVNRDDPAQRNVIAMDRQKALAELGRTKAEVEQIKKEIAGIQDEARKAGVPAGWVR